jgi:DNA-directed RNA polymerase subunit RPC12/RpoP
MRSAVKRFIARLRGALGKAGDNARILELEMVRHDYACKKCEKTFTAWDDSARICAYCGSKRVFKVFLTPPAASTGNAARIEKLAEKQLNAAGFSDYSNAHGRIRRTRKTHPSEIAAVAAAKANNIPITATGPAGAGINAGIQQMRDQYRQLGPGGVIKAFGGQGAKTTITSSPRGPGALVQTVVQRGKQIAPLAAMGERIYHPKAKEDGAKLKEMLKK